MEKQKPWEEHINHLLNELMSAISTIESSGADPVLAARQGVIESYKSLSKLRNYILRSDFPSLELEIKFFKQIKPSFQAILIFYIELFDILVKNSCSSKNDIVDAFKKEFAKHAQFFDFNLEFFKYYHSGATHLDSHYFTRAGLENPFNIQLRNIDTDPAFSSLNDFLVARGWANEKLAKYLNGTIMSITNIDTSHKEQKKKTLIWTDPRIGMSEMIYFFKCKGTFNNGTATTKDIAEYFSECFGRKIDNHSRDLQQILFRKEGPTVYQDAGKAMYLAYIDSLDK